MKFSYWAFNFAYVAYQNLLYYQEVMASLGDFFSHMFSGNKMDSQESLETRSVKPDRFSLDPHKAWQKKKSTQIYKKLEPVDPDTPISADKVRFVCISDTHTVVEKQRRMNIPDGDVLLHAGDFTIRGTTDEVHLVNEYLGTLPHKHKVVIAGNHDMTFDLEFIKQKRKTWMWELTRENYESRLEAYGVDSVHDLMTNCTYLQDSLIEIDGIKIFGSPWQPGSGNWGFSRRRGWQCLEKWKKIPLDTDILLTHGPPLGHGDNCCVGRLAQLFNEAAENHIGCVDLLNVIQKLVKPKYHVFGHIHEGYGITSDGATTFINAATCDERYMAVNPPIVFDIPVPPGFTKEGNLTWLIKNEPWKVRNNDILDISGDSDDDEIVFDTNDCNDDLGDKRKDTINDILSSDHFSDLRDVKQKDDNNESDNDETVFDNNDCNDHQENEIKDTPLMNEFLSGDH